MTDWELAHAYDTVKLHRRGGAAKIELNRPDALNAWTRQFGVDLLAALKACADDDEVRAVLITGAGRGFSSGADLKEGFEPGQVALLTTQQRHPEQRNAVDVGGWAAYWDAFFAAEDVFYGHVLGFKGLERPVVVLAVNGFKQPERTREMLYVGLSRARTLLGWEPKVGLEEGLTKTLAYFRERV